MKGKSAMQKFVWLVIGAVLGVGGGIALAPRPQTTPGESDSQAPAREEAETLRADNQRLQVELEALREERLQAGEEAAELAARVQHLEERVAKDATSKPVEAVAEVALESKVPIQFGEHADLEALADADWQALADAILTMTPQIVDLFAKMEAGEEVDQASQIAIAQENQKLVGFALSVMGKLPTHAAANGEYTHPIALSNMLAKTLESSDMPLSDAQRQEMQRYGEEYESEWSRVNGDYSDDTYAIRKLLDEVELKSEFMSGVENSLSEDQFSSLFPEATRGRNRLDLFSPALMLVTNPPLPVTSIDDLQGRLMESTAQGLGVDAEVLARHEGIFRRWVDDVSGHMGTPVRRASAGFYDLDSALAAGRAQLRAMEQLAAQLDLSEEQLEAMRQQSGFVVPRLVVDEDGGAVSEGGGSSGDGTQ